MSLVLYFHPLASFCHKVLIALYENQTPFEPQLVNLGSPDSSAQLLEHWPFGKIPVLHDRARQRTIPETSIIIEYLARHFPGPIPLVPADPEAALEARLWDRVFDNYVQVPMQKFVAERLRAEGQRDAQGVADAVSALNVAYGVLERQLQGKRWTIGDAFSIADCAAAPALFYAQTIVPFGAEHPQLRAYFERLSARPSVVRVIDEARPYFGFYPLRDAIPARFLAPAAEGG